MRSTYLLLSMALVATSAFAQNSADQPGTASPQEQQGNAMQGSQHMKEMHEGAIKHGTMRDMKGRHEKMMQSSQSDLAAMRAQLQKMREQTARMSDPSRKDAQQLNNDMWQSLIDHMDKHMTKMNSMMHSKRDGALGNAVASESPARYAQ